VDRDPQAVLDDVRDGLVSIEAAARDYGVAITPETLDIIPEETNRMRKAMS
jgi:N-methylhydantoinase B